MGKKLHQIIAGEGQVNGEYGKIVAETLHTFKGGSLFEGFTKHYEPLRDDGARFPDEGKEVVTTVAKRLAWNEKPIIKLFDHEFTRDMTNTFARADLVIDGQPIAKDVPAVTLLAIEKRLTHLRQTYDAIPTLDMSYKWEETEKDSDVLKHGPIETIKTEKTIVPIVLAPATDKHPAQVEKVTKDIPIGRWMQTNFSGRITPDTKAELLTRIDRAIAAVRDARMEANNAEVQERIIGEALFQYIHAPIA